MPTPPDHPLSGAHEKLIRAYQNIGNLQGEITAFLEQGEYPVIPNDDPAAFEKAAKIHANRIVPARFSILSGEIVHHLRSCLDHIAWQLTCPQRGETSPHAIEFPILLTKPINKAGVERYERKIEGISPKARAVIESLQPYHRPPAMLTGPDNDPLWLIHDMDRIDKHRELILAVAGFHLIANGWAELYTMLYRQADLPEAEIAALSRSLDPQSKVSPQVAFRDFGGRKIQPVIPGLTKLARYTHDVLVIFANECF